MDDSGDDLFITQSTFSKNVATQDAENAAEYLLNSSYDFNASHSPKRPDGDIVQYLDFTREPEGGYTVRTEEESQLAKMDGSEPISIEPTFEAQAPYAKLSDEELAAAMDQIEKDASENSKRFGNLAARVSDECAAENAKKKYATSSERKGDWAYRAFTDWVTTRNVQAAQAGETNFLPSNLLHMTKRQMSSTLCKFVLEVVKKNGTPYPSETLYDLVISLQLYLKHNGIKYRFLDDECFEDLRNTLDNRMKALSASGYHAKRNSAEIITEEQENSMWEGNILGEDNPKQLSDTLLYLVGMHFALRAGNEHRNLRVGANSQIKLHKDDDKGLWYLEYSEDMSKTNQGGLDHKNIKRKVVRAYQNVANPDRCIVHFWKKYLALRPKGDDTPDDFYLRPLPFPAVDGSWFAKQPIGRVKLSQVVANLAKQAGISGRITNHSLRASCASRLYRQAVDEQLICEKTGHRSDAVRCYKRTSTDQMKDMSDILYGNKRQKVDDCKLCATAPQSVDAHVETPKSDENGKPSISVNVTLHLK